LFFFFSMLLETALATLFRLCPWFSPVLVELFLGSSRPSLSDLEAALCFDRATFYFLVWTGGASESLASAFPVGPDGADTLISETAGSRRLILSLCSFFCLPVVSFFREHSCRNSSVLPDSSPRSWFQLFFWTHLSGSAISLPERGSSSSQRCPSSCFLGVFPAASRCPGFFVSFSNCRCPWLSLIFPGHLRFP